MNPQEMSWKARINRYAKEHDITPQVVLQNIMFERFLRRLSKSDYKNHFVLKGGVLVAAIVGLDYRSTMDIDTTLRHYPLSEEMLTQAINEITSIDENDDTVFRLVRIESIRQEDEYGGLRISMQAQSGNIVVPFSIDVSTGDAITPQPIEMKLPSFFDGLSPVQVWSYNVETIVAEKIETILRRGVLSTRPRDFYDVHILTHTLNLDYEVLKQAVQRTAQHRNSVENITRWREMMAVIEASPILQRHWEKYRNNFPYAKSIEYKQLMETLGKVLDIIR